MYILHFYHNYGKNGKIWKNGRKWKIGSKWQVWQKVGNGKNSHFGVSKLCYIHI